MRLRTPHFFKTSRQPPPHRPLGTPAFVTTAIQVGESEVSWDENMEWLAKNGLLCDDLAVCDRRFEIFSKMLLRPGAWREDSWFYQQLLPFESNLAAYQDDIGEVKSYPSTMDVRQGVDLVRCRPIQYNEPQRKWIREQIDALLKRGVIRECYPGELYVYLHKVALVTGREDRPA